MKKFYGKSVSTSYTFVLGNRRWVNHLAFTIGLFLFWYFLISDKDLTKSLFWTFIISVLPDILVFIYSKICSLLGLQ